jgi:hypothetical protein
MSNVFIMALIISSVYLLCRFIEMRFILKENKSLKILLRDTLIVYIAVICGTFVMDQVSSLSDIVKTPPNVFTNEPGF